MKVIQVMFDSLNRHMLPVYGCDWVHAPNFERLARRSVVFDNAYVGSMPCIPARRELHTGRYNFLHRAWGPLEPFDDCMPEMLRANGVYAHLATDHYHYWEDGGATYHNRYSSYEFCRGQEYDLWRGVVKQADIPEHIGQIRDVNLVSREYMGSEETQPQAKTFANGLEFLDVNQDEDNWFLHIETFDPHEPYVVPQKYLDLYDHRYDGPMFDWPPYRMVQETPEQIAHIRTLNAALISMCDAYLGRVLDKMDALGLWDDTMLIINTDHGFMLGEHDYWAKCHQPFYNEIAHTPLFIWDPRSRVADERRDALVQTIDIAPTILEYFGVDRTERMEGVPLRDTIANGAGVRDMGLFGMHGMHVNITDGRYVYMRAPARPENVPLYNYTLMPTHMRGFFPVDNLQDCELAEPFDFTQGCKTLKCRASSWFTNRKFEYPTMLFDLEADPAQNEPLQDEAVERRLTDRMVELMRKNDAPAEQYERLGLKG